MSDDERTNRSEPQSPGRDRIELAPGVVVPRRLARFSYTRSGGPGGQSVNKVSTKAELRIHIDDLPIPDRARSRLKRFAKGRITGEGEILITSESERSQRRNRADCLEKLRELLIRAMTPPKPRKKTKPGRGAVERRLKEKRERSEAKQRRRRLEP